MIRINLPTDLTGDAGWAEKGHKPLQIALLLMPFADIAFLWFIAAIRDELGEHEDQFSRLSFSAPAYGFVDLNRPPHGLMTMDQQPLLDTQAPLRADLH